MTGAGAPPDRRRAAAGAAVVAVQGALLAVLAAPARRGRPAVAARAGRVLTAAGVVGVLVAARDLGPGLTPSPVPAARGELRSDGLYAHVRHPMYTAVLLCAAGRVLTAGRRRAWAGALLVALLTGKARWEEAMLAQHFPGYTGYAAVTPRFVPRLRAPGQPPSGRPV